MTDLNWPQRRMPEDYARGQYQHDIATAAKRAADVPWMVASATTGAAIALKFGLPLLMLLSVPMYFIAMRFYTAAVEQASKEWEIDIQAREAWLDSGQTDERS